jgi:hypothetical protein
MELWVVYLGLVAFAAAMRLTWRADARAARAAPDPAAPAEPCWTETISSDGRYFYGRSHCVNDELLAMDPQVRDLPPASLG